MSDELAKAWGKSLLCHREEEQCRITRRALERALEHLCRQTDDCACRACHAESVAMGAAFDIGRALWSLSDVANRGGRCHLRHGVGPCFCASESADDAIEVQDYLNLGAADAR